MNTVFNELTMGSQQRYNGIRRKVQFFSTFAGGVIEALRESGFRLCAFEKQAAYAPAFGAPVGRPAPGQPAPPPPRRGNDNIELFFEQQDRDQCTVLIVPYRTDLPFLAKGRYFAQLGLELSRYSNDPDTLRQAVAVNAKASFGSFLGGSRLPKLYLDSPPDIKPPGTMTFELRGARLVVAMNVLVNLAKYRLSDFDLDIDAIREDLEAYFYGLEKYLSLLLENFGGRVKIINEGDVSGLAAKNAEESFEQTAPAFQQSEQPAPAAPQMMMAGAPLPPRPPVRPVASTVPLEQAHRGDSTPPEEPEFFEL